ncbi:MAG: hypothetical protein O7F73_04845 [Gammaproteobacteria bacterium]|nr:hypothetical protein [Gammaproteobacteria bacterium]
MRSTTLTLLLLVLPGILPASAAEYTLNHGTQAIVVNTHFLFSDERDQLILGWIETVTGTLASVYGRWPRDELRVEVSPIGLHTEDPVPWAKVQRGHPDTVSFYIDALASRDKLINNWTAYHEFSHLLIPYRGWGDVWFSEGLASYYQNLLQARQGVFSQEEMWERLHAGFMRGRNRNKRPLLSLAELSPQMHDTGSYMRVYWSGAWYFLRADVELRRRSNNRQSLDTALEQLNRCCAEQRLSARDIALRLDEVNEQELFLPLFVEVSNSYAVPEFETLFKQLGIDIVGNGVRLRNSAEQLAIRDGIGRQM